MRIREAESLFTPVKRIPAITERTACYVSGLIQPVAPQTVLGSILRISSDAAHGAAGTDHQRNLLWHGATAAHIAAGSVPIGWKPRRSGQLR